VVGLLAVHLSTTW